MTIPLLEVSFNRMFEFGQAYVALSRATSLQGLTLHSFQAQAIRAHPLVKDFYRHIAAINQRVPPHHQHPHPHHASLPPPINDDILEVCLRDFVQAFQVDFDPKAVDYDQWIDSRGRSAATSSVESIQRQRVEERRYEETNHRSQFVPPPAPVSQPERPMMTPSYRSETTMIHQTQVSSTVASATMMSTSASRRPSGLLNSSFSAASFARPMNPLRTDPSSGFQDAGHSNAHGDDWLDQDFLAKKRAEAAQRIAAMEQHYLQSQATQPTAMSETFVPLPAPPLPATSSSSNITVRRESPPTTSTVLPTTLPPTSSSAPSSSSKNKEAVEIVNLLDSADEDSIPYVPVPMPTMAPMASNGYRTNGPPAGEPPTVNDFGGYGSRPHLICNESPLNRVLHSSAVPPVYGGGASSHTAPQASTSEPVTVGANGVVLTDSLKRKLEENRQRALEKLEKFKYVSRCFCVTLDATRLMTDLLLLLCDRW